MRHLTLFPLVLSLLAITTVGSQASAYGPTCLPFFREKDDVVISIEPTAVTFTQVIRGRIELREIDPASEGKAFISVFAYPVQVVSSDRVRALFPQSSMEVTASGGKLWNLRLRNKSGSLLERNEEVDPEGMYRIDLEFSEPIPVSCAIVITARVAWDHKESFPDLIVKMSDDGNRLLAEPPDINLLVVDHEGGTYHAEAAEKRGAVEAGGLKLEPEREYRITRSTTHKKGANSPKPNAELPR